ncbi:anti-sigma factor [Croceicoccus ponticola]|uniref:Anti-sigma factor n=1 Tax=Croceicoccus ponticola TaxID=2217664 RepID=A0A437GXR4_9SPHN|nr:anti-sigma factor [Croceicoccus ponticola]RVQ67184.1 anti-sigma factor [Croceicoccus ponticola]
MSLTREELAAFADGELDPERHAEVERVVAADPELAREVAAHRALRARLSAHYAPILDDPVPEHLGALLQRQGNVVDLAKRRESQSAVRSGIPRWGWIAGPALAASLILALFIPRDTAYEGYAGKQVAAALNDQLVAAQPANARVRILLSFRDHSGAYCRAFAEAEQGGIACKDAQGWRVIDRLDGSNIESGVYRQAGSVRAELMAHAQEMAKGSALDAEQEAEAKRRLWQ